jgi:hypothetical protein
MYFLGGLIYLSDMIIKNLTTTEIINLCKEDKDFNRVVNDVLKNDDLDVIFFNKNRYKE